MSANRPGHAGCHCCTDEAATVPAEFHRDLVTGAVPDAPNEFLDAREELWSCHDGDLTGLTQETITQNCTATGSAVTHTGNGADEVNGYLRLAVANVVPTVKNFSALHVVWTGQTFNAFDHVEHIAAGSLRAYAAARRWRTDFTGESDRTNLFGSGIGPITVWGLVIRSGSDILVKLTPNPASGELFDQDGPNHRCWRPTSDGEWKLLVDGNFTATLTTAQARQYGLTVDPIANQVTHEVGFCFGVVTGSDDWDGDLASSYSTSFDFDTLNIYREFYLNCVAAFVNLSTLHVSTPIRAASHVSNSEPTQLAGVSVELTLTTLPAFDASQHSNAMQSHHAAGYAYTGSTVISLPPGDVTVTWWYTPCAKLTISFEQPDQYVGPVWVGISHSDEYTYDLCDGSGDNAEGQVTTPTLVGWYFRDFYRVCQYTPGSEILDTTWFGNDCIDNPNQTSPTQKHGVVGECHGSDDPLPVCLQGNLPNQLPWMTDCWSLDPIAIGYRLRVTDVYSAGGYVGPCSSVATDPADFAPDGVNQFQSCRLTFLKNMGFGFALEAIGDDRIAGHFYMDITE